MQTKTQDRLAGVLTQVRRAVDANGPDSPTDGELLARFVAARDQAAFELLVWRHGTMVLQTCRRLVSRLEDAEDAFQATFLALVRQAAGISKREAVAGWLHRVACRVALRVRSQNARRAECERASVHQSNGFVSADGEAVDPLVWVEVRQVLDGEVNRLPAKLRVPFVLCYLEGLTNEEAARQLDLPKGTVLSRLARARERLRGRLSRRGLAVTAGAFVPALGQEAAMSAAAAPLVVSTIKVAMLIAAGQATAAVAAAPVALLTEGVVRAMFLSKIKMTMAVVLSVGLVSGAGSIFYQSQAAGQAVDPTERVAPAEKTKPAQIVAQTEKKKASVTPPAAPKPAPAPKPSRAAQDAQSILDTYKAKADLAERQYWRAQEVLQAIKATLDQARAQYELARAEYERAKQVVPGPVADPKKSAPLMNIAPAESARGPALPAMQTDLIQLATAYLDSVRDLETAQVRLKLLEVTRGSAGELAIARINVPAAERKVNLLRAIIESSLDGAQNELDLVRAQFKQGIIGASHVSAADSKVRMLKLILGSVK